MTITPINFTAKTARNWDGEKSQSRLQFLKPYDDEIQKAKDKKSQMVQLERYMTDGFVMKPVLDKLPKRDIVNIATTTRKDYFTGEDIETVYLEYIPMTEETRKKAYKNSQDYSHGTQEHFLKSGKKMEN